METRLETVIADLRAGEMLKLRRATGALVRVESGAVWVTESGAPGDAVLPSGASYRVERGRAVVIEALGAARVAIRPVAPVQVRGRLDWLGALLPARLRGQ